MDSSAAPLTKQRGNKQPPEANLSKSGTGPKGTPLGGFCTSPIIQTSEEGQNGRHSEDEHSTLTILVRDGANQDMFGVYTYNDGQAGDAHAQRECQVADDIDIWWIVEIGNNASR